MSKIIYTSCPAKVSLFGEYSWLIGEAIVMAVESLRTYVAVERSHNNFYQFYSYNMSAQKKLSRKQLFEYDGEWESYLKACINILQKKYNIVVPYINIHVFSQMPLAAGLSSSTSLIVAAIGAVANFCNILLTKKELAHLAYLAEHNELMIPCGQIDHYGCVFGGIVYIDNRQSPSRNVKKYIPDNAFSVLIVDTKIQKNTKVIINKLKDRVVEKDPNILPHFSIQKSLINQARVEFDRGNYNLNLIGTWLNNAQKSFKNNLKVSNDLFDELCITAIRNGADGAKITGGGTGGCMFAISSFERELSVRQSLDQYNLKVYSTTFSKDGFRIEKIWPEEAIFYQYD